MAAPRPLRCRRRAETKHELARFHKVPYFQYEHHRIWGLTGIILRDFATQVLGFAPPV